jgi:serine/threonine-protein kinase
MPLAPGSRVGPYEVIAPLGAGGMGEVFRARDPRLGREVALKALPPMLANDPDRLARFEREAKLLAALSHPNIAAIYGVEEDPSGRVLVLELAEGETLEARLARGRMPVDEVVAVARAIADALESAHERGIVHRDLKPANIKVAPDGRVKVLDFGLATAFGDTVAGDASGMSQSPTISARMTGAGMLLGTAAYMSPEQARGKMVDKRADIWSFGVVLWEALAGRRLFQGETVTDLLAAVLREEVDWKALPAGLPPDLLLLLRRCLERDPRRRLRDIGEARLILEDFASGVPAEEVGAVPAPGAAGVSAARRPGVWVASLGMALLAGALAWTARGARDAAPHPVSHLSFSLPGTADLDVLDDRQMLALSKDGRTVVFKARDGGVGRLYARRLEDAAAVPIAGTEGAADLFLSPDGEWVAFTSDGKLRKVPLRGGAAVTLCDSGQGRGGAWGPDGTIVFSPEVTSGLMRLPSSGGVPVPLTVPDVAKGERSHRWPEFTPDGKSVLFTVGTLDKPGDYDDGRIDIVSLEGKNRHPVYTGASMARVAPNGTLLVASRGVINALPFDAGRGAVRGQPVPVFEGVAGDPSSGVVYFSVADDGAMTYFAGGPTGRERDVVWVARDGKPTPLPIPAREYRDVRMSPDGTRLALSEGAGAGRQSDISIYDIARQTVLKLTEDGKSGTPVWTPDSRAVVYDDYSSNDLVKRVADGSGLPEKLGQAPGDIVTPTWVAPDLSVVLLQRIGAPTKGDIMALALKGGAVTPVVATPAHETEAILSPDGHYLAYTYTQTADPGVIVQSYPGPGGRWMISDGRAVSPRWPREGKEIFYLNQEWLMRVPITSLQPFTYGRPEQVLDLHALRTSPRWGNSQYDVTPDGQHFVFLIDRQHEAGPKQVNVILNWTEDVTHLAGR